MRWKSPWGEGFPGWHIECSAMATKYLGVEFDIHGGGMDLMFPHHESEIAQSTICNHVSPVRYWLHSNMITVNGKKMGKSYNNQIQLSQMFTGDHPLLAKPFSPITIRFFILQSHYRSTLDFSSDALIAAEKGLKRLWDAYEFLKATIYSNGSDTDIDASLDEKMVKLVHEFDEFMDDDFNTAKVMANMFEIVPVINSIKDGHLKPGVLSGATFELLQSYFKIYLEDIFGLKSIREYDAQLNAVMDLLIDLRKEVKKKKDFVTSDMIRNRLHSSGILIRDDKEGNMTWDIV
jgi:cysteinyl-tRNA synthetase